MTKKMKISIIAGVMAVVVAVSITLGVMLPNMQYAAENRSLFERAREVLLKNFAPVTLGSKAPLKRTINSENPMNLLNHYGNEPVLDLWASVPDNQKPYTIMLLIPGQTLLPGQEKAFENLEKWADECEANGIPYAIQNINGETHMEARPPVAYLEERFAKKHKYFYGLNGAELYNGVDWRGDAESDNSQYIIDNIKLCAKYGAYYIWTDTNRNYKNGMLMQWLENNEAFYSTFKEYSEYICLLNKESLAHPSTYAVMQGLWLAGLVGNWGVASDWWHWQCDGDKKSLFGENDQYVDDEWEMIFSFPENMYVQSMMLVMSRGATCFKAEAPNFSTSYGGKPLAGFEYGISPLLDRIISGEISIPTKDDVFAVTDFAVLGKENYSKANYDYEESNLYPKNGNLGIVPLLPKNLRLAERKTLLDKGVQLVEKKMGDRKFMEMYGSNDADTYLTNIKDQWYYINNVENERKTKYARFTPKYASASEVYISAEEHTSAIFTEKSHGMDVYLSNYRTDKLPMFKGTTDEMKKLGHAAYIGKFLGLDENGDPLGVSDKQLRKTVIKVKGSLNGGKPEVRLKSSTDGTGKNGRKFTLEESYDPASGELTLTIMHNGVVELSVLTDEKTFDTTPKQKGSISDTKNKNDYSVAKLEELTAEKLENPEAYTYFSWLEYNRLFEKARVMISERTYSKSQIRGVASDLEKAKRNMVEVGEAVELCKQAMQISGRSDAINNALDATIRELCSSKQYIQGRSNKLMYASMYKKGSIIGDLPVKRGHLHNRCEELKSLLNA